MGEIPYNQIRNGAGLDWKGLDWIGLDGKVDGLDDWYRLLKN